MSFNLEKIKVLHIEATTVCQAACPQCDRENAELYNDETDRHSLSLAQVQQAIPESTVENLDKVFACGTFGDPAANSDLLDIFRWFRSINPDITLGMNTNGGLRNADWWTEIGTLFSKPLDYVVFSIDGLEDTNHVYRRNVNWKKVMENARAFTKTGASAHWDMLIFDYNKHQIDDAEQLATQIGFSWFRCKVSKRFQWNPGPGLNPPEGIDLPNVEDPDSISCHALREKSLYLAANGELLPCCWMGSRIFNRDVLIDAAVHTPNFEGVIRTWDTDPLPVCKRNCGVQKNSNSSFENQWFRQTQIK